MWRTVVAARGGLQAGAAVPLKVHHVDREDVLLRRLVWRACAVITQYEVLGVTPCGARLGIRKGDKGAVRLPNMLVLIKWDLGVKPCGGAARNKER